MTNNYDLSKHFFSRVTAENGYKIVGRIFILILVILVILSPFMMADALKTQCNNVDDPTTCKINKVAKLVISSIGILIILVYLGFNFHVKFRKEEAYEIQ